MEGRVRARRYRYRGQTKSTVSGERKERMKKRKLGSESRELEGCKTKKLAILDERRRTSEKKLETEKSKLRRQKSYSRE